MGQFAEAVQAEMEESVKVAFVDQGYTGDKPMEAAAQNGIELFPNAFCVVTTSLAAFGVFFLAQNRDRRLFEPLVQLFESMNPEAEDEWIFSGRLFFFGHRLLAGACPHDPQRAIDLALNSNLKPETRALAVSAIGLFGTYADIARADAVRLLRDTFKPIRSLKDPLYWRIGPEPQPGCIAANLSANCNGCWHPVC